MSDADESTDPASPVPPAAPLRGENPEPDQPEPSEVLPGGDATEVDHLVDDQ